MVVIFCVLALSALVTAHSRIVPNLDNLNIELPDLDLPNFDLPNLDDLEFGVKSMVYRCRSGDQCSTCPPSAQHASWTSVSVLGSVLYNRTKTECAQDCRENIECRDHVLGRHCACVPRNLCLSGSACEPCEQDAVTSVMGQRFCCEGCRRSSVSIHVDPPHVLVPTCVCNAP